MSTVHHDTKSPKHWRTDVPTHHRALMAPLRLCALALLVLTLAACGTNNATPTPLPLVPTPGQLTVVNARGGIVPIADGNGAIYFSVLNGTDADVQLLYANSNVGQATEFHESVHNHSTGVVSMEPAPEGWTIPANSVLTLEPGGKHLMVTHIAEPLEEGDRISLSLTFDNGQVQILTVPVVVVEE